MKRSILILGGTGAMGGHLVNFLSKIEDFQIYVTSRKNRKKIANITYIEGNARDKGFIRELLTDNLYDCIVDFMNYNLDEFEYIHKELLASTSHYIFLSSCRVFDKSEQPITEESPRLLETSKDIAFLATNRYALRKAREEDLLKDSGMRNYTIVRPYITYSGNRLQLGICEKEDWLYRTLNDKSVLLSERILDKKTTLTYGKDVSWGIFQILLNTTPNGSDINLTTQQTITWGEILSLYNNIIYQETGKHINLYTAAGISKLEDVYEGGYNTIYDRQWNRFFDNTKANKICGEINYMEIKEGLSMCLKEFIKEWKTKGNSVFLSLNEKYHSLSDEYLNNNHIVKTKVFIK